MKQDPAIEYILQGYSEWLLQKFPYHSSAYRVSVLSMTRSFFIHTQERFNIPFTQIHSDVHFQEFHNFLEAYTYILPEETIPLLFEPISLYQKYTNQNGF